MSSVLVLSRNVKIEVYSDLGFQIAHSLEEMDSVLGKETPFLFHPTEDKKEIHFPYNMNFEVYYARSGGKFYLSLSLADLASHLDSEISNEQRQKLYSNWTCDTGKTVYQDINRVKPGDILDVGSLKFHRKRFADYTQVKAANVDDFNESVTSSIEGLACKTDKVGVLFSGGADSLLVCLTLDRLGMPFVCYTAFPKQEFDSAIDDKFKAVTMAQYFGWEHQLVEVDFEKNEISDLDQFIFNMPQSVHLGIYFKALVDKAKNDGVTVLFSGQNMDSLYNLGPTSLFDFSKSAVADFIRRCFLNSTYFKFLQVKGISGLISKLIAFGFALPFSVAYSLFKRKVYFPSWSKADVINSYQLSTDYSTFTKYGSKRCSKSMENNVEVKTSLLDYKIENFLMTGAPQAIHTSCRLSEIRAALPFSSETMIKTFYRLPLRVKDILYPKYFVYSLIKELAGKSYSDIRKESSHGKTPGYVGIDYQEWCRTVLPKTRFGKSLYKAVDNNGLSGSTPAQQLMDRLARYWVKIQTGQKND
jgi:hypothetical protein